MAERKTSQVGIQMFKLKKSIAAIILLEILEEDGKRESRRGRTSGWIRKREEKVNFNNIVQEWMIEVTRGYREMMRITHDGFLENGNVKVFLHHIVSYALSRLSLK